MKSGHEYDLISRFNFSAAIRGNNSFSHHFFHIHKNHFKRINDLSKQSFMQGNHVSFKKTCALTRIKDINI